MKAWALVLLMLLPGAAVYSSTFAQDSAPPPAPEAGGVVVLKFNWLKERIAPRASISPLVTQEEMVRQAQLERQLANARNSTNAGAAARAEAQLGRHEQARARATQTERPRHAYRYTARVRNDGDKTINSIDWDYLFIDPTTQGEVARHRFTSDVTLKPGKSKEISVLYPVEPFKKVSAGMLDKKQPTYQEQVVLMRVQYSDGTAWQRQ